MAQGEDFQAIVAEQTEGLRSKHKLQPAKRTDRSARFQNDNVFVEFWYDKDRNHFAEADVGLLDKPAEFRESYPASEIAQFHHVDLDRGNFGQGDRLAIRPQVRAIAALLTQRGERLLNGDRQEFLRLHYFSAGYSAHYTEVASTGIAPPPDPPPVLRYVLWSLLIGLAAGTVIGYLKLWTELPALIGAIRSFVLQ